MGNPYGFSKQQRKELLPKLIKRIELLGHTVWESFSRNDNLIDFKNPDRPYCVGQANEKDIEKCDAIFCSNLV